jgi:hypothetical protein
MLGGVVVSDEQVQKNKMGWTAEKFAFDTLIREGWTIEPPRCAVCTVESKNKER